MKERKFGVNTALELHNKILNIYKSQYDKLTKARKKRIKVQNLPENLSIDLHLDENEGNLPPIHALEGDEDSKLEPEETITERIKLNPQKKNQQQQD